MTALVPARNEAALISHTLRALESQGYGMRVIVIDDQSIDSTGELAEQTSNPNLEVVKGSPLPESWSGKLWALEQGRQQVRTPYTLMLDADIALLPGLVSTALNKMKREGIRLLSLMAAPNLTGFWAKLLMPAFVYFFKWLYPFRLSNSSSHKMAAAAGGFILLETNVLTEIGGYASIRDALIDDCTLARRVKSHNFKTWIGLTHSAHSHRPYRRLKDLWDMVARTAYTQLNYSLGLLLACTATMLLAYLMPVVGLLYSEPIVRILGITASMIMVFTLLPILRFYDMSPSWAIALPAVAVLFLCMTWASAISYWRGQRATWRGRAYIRRA